MAKRGVSPKYSQGVRSSDGAPIPPSVSFFHLTEGSIAPALWKNEKFGPDFLFRRHDYHVEASGGTQRGYV
jgi:hypothetical protein